MKRAASRLTASLTGSGRLSRAARAAVAVCGAALAAAGQAQQASPGQPAPPSEPAERAPAEQADGQSDAARTVPAARQAENVAIIMIEGAIDRWTAVSVEERMAKAEEDGADAIVFEIDSPGGEVGAVLEICNMIKNSAIANTVAWVNPDAYSGGAIIALACREIVVTPYATMGDAAPIQVSPFGLQELAPTERQKILAPLLAEVVDSARRNGYDENFVQGFLMLGVELWLVEQKETGERLFVTEKEYQVLFGEDPPTASPRISAPSRDEDERPSGEQAEGGAPADADGEFDPASPSITEDTARSVEQAIATPSQRPDISGADRGEYRLVEYTTDGSTLLTLKTDQLKRYGFAVREVKDDEELKAFFGASNLSRVSESWSVNLARFLSSLPVRGLLVVVFLLALFMEMAAPGLGLAGAVSLGCLGLLLAPQFVVGAAAWWAVAAIGLGVMLVLVEVFVLPGFGVFGIAGILSLMAGLLGVMVGPGGLFPDTPNERSDLLYSVATLFLAIFATGVGIYFISKHYSTLPLFNRLVLTGDRRGESGAGMLAAMSPASEQTAVREGDVGVATTPLRPSGTAEFGDRLVDVVAAAGWIETGAKIRAIEVGRFRVVVEAADEGPPADAGPPAGQEGSEA